MTVYADEIFIQNFASAYALLYICSKILNVKVCAKRLFFASCAGAAIALISFIYGINLVIFSGFVLFVSAYGIKKGVFLQNIVIFSVIKILSGFFCAFICSQLSLGVVKNGITYLETDFTVMIISLIVSYPLIILMMKIFRLKVKKKLCQIKITKNKNSVEGTAIFDSGNLLTEPYSGYKVIVADKSLINRLFPDGIDNILNEPTRNKIRFVPFNTISGTGVIEAFLPDAVFIDGEKHENIYIGISPKRLSPNNEYNALIGV